MVRLKTYNSIFRLIILSTFSLISLISVGQNIGINTTRAAPNASALLDIDASPGNSKGLLIPRLTTAQMNCNKHSCQEMVGPVAMEVQVEFTMMVVALQVPLVHLRVVVALVISRMKAVRELMVKSLFHGKT